MTWYDTQTSTTSINFTEWNNMVDVIRQFPVVLFDDNDTETLTLNQNIIVGDTTAGAIALTLPEAADSLGKQYTIFLETDGGSNITVTCAGSDTLDGSNTIGTLADAEDYIQLVAVSDDRWLILINNGVALS